MKEKNLDLLLSASEDLSSILLFSKLAEAGIENDTIEKIWDLYPFFRVVKNLVEKALNNLQQIKDDIP